MPSHTCEAETTRVIPFVRRKKSARSLRASASPCEAPGAAADPSARAPNAKPNPARATASVRMCNTSSSREVDLVRRPEALPAVVQQPDLEGTLAAGEQSEGDERIVAERRGELESAHPLSPEPHLHFLEVERLGHLHERPVGLGKPRAVRVPDLELGVDELAAADPASLHQLRDADLRRVDFGARRASPRRGSPGATAGIFWNADPPTGLPTTVAIALGGDRHFRVAVVHARLERHVDGAIGGRETEHTL